MNSYNSHKIAHPVWHFINTFISVRELRWNLHCIVEDRRAKGKIWDLVRAIQRYAALKSTEERDFTKSAW